MKSLLIKALTAIFAPAIEGKVTTKGITEVGNWLTKQVEDSQFREYQQVKDFQVLADAMLNEHYSHPLYSVYKRRIKDILHTKRLLIEWQFTEHKICKK